MPDKVPLVDKPIDARRDHANRQTCHVLILLDLLKISLDIVERAKVSPEAKGACALELTQRHL